MISHLFIILFSIFSFYLNSDELKKINADGFAEGITVDLREPFYEDGILTTEKGGVITGPDLRIQALNIRYVRKLIDGQPVYTIDAEGQLLIEFGEYVFVGEKLFYDFQKKEGTITQGRTSSGPWFFGGEHIELRPDKSYVIYDGYVTTSENIDPDWQIFSERVHIFPNRDMDAKKVQFRILNYSVLWIPSLKVNLNFIFDSPIRYRFKWGGNQGPRFGLTYELFSWGQWKTFVRFDYRLTRGPGGGFEAYYQSEDHSTSFESINYIANDSSLLNPHEKLQYRFEGTFAKTMDEGKTNILLTYDKISDLDLPSSYYDKDFYFETSKRTQLLVRRQENEWISNFYTRVRINNFQTVKEELPSFGVNFHPFSIASTGIIFENSAKASFLNFKYANNLAHVQDYSSTRFDYRPSFYCPFKVGPVTFTPEIGSVAIFYGNSPEKESKFLALGILGYDIRTQLYQCQEKWKHVIEPYIDYRYYTQPTISPSEHYIFDIEDGWYHLNKLTFGVKNSIYNKNLQNCISRLLFADIYAHAFFNSSHIHPTIPKAYSRLVFFSFPTVRHTFETGWDFRHHEISHFNLRMDWTVNEDLALSMEFRHRNAYSWRKADYELFFLEAYRSEYDLRHSSLSDQRDTLLLYAFYRFHPNWAFEIASRQGWNRLTEPKYTEFEIDVLTTIQTAWHVKFSYQHQQGDDRVAMYVTVGLKPPRLKENICKCYFE